MGLIKEPLEIDFNIQSKPWSAEDLADFRVLMQSLKAKKKQKKERKQTTIAA
jgi:hypothetical protein